MRKGKILVTGGAGYIGSHTLVDLLENNYDVISVDNFSNSSPVLINQASKITHTPIQNYKVDLCDKVALKELFFKEQNIVGIIHFAAYKSVPQSVSDPLSYYKNNLVSLLNILELAKEFSIKNIVFSSSCSVYGNAESLPVSERTSLKAPASPYANTKVVGEQICADFVNANPSFNIILLRYFNPVGAHSSAMIGELNEKPENLVPVITQTAIGLRESMDVFGDDYDTRDGTCIRDYIHVSDIAHAHTLAIEKSLESPNRGIKIYNLGTGNGVTVLELIQAFEKVSGVKLHYQIKDRRSGDVVAVYADNSLAEKELGWKIEHDLNSMMDSAWKWQMNIEKIKKDEI